MKTRGPRALLSTPVNDSETPERRPHARDDREDAHPGEGAGDPGEDDDDGLREKYAEVFGEPAASGNRAWLARRVGWRMQALAEVDLSDRYPAIAEG